MDAAPAHLPSPPAPTLPPRPTFGALAVLAIGLAFTTQQVLVNWQIDPARFERLVASEGLFSPNAVGEALLILVLTLLVLACGQLIVNEDFTPLGFPGEWSARALGRAVGLGVVVFLLLDLGLPALVEQVYPRISELYPDVLQGIIRTPAELARAYLILFLAAAVREELWRVALLRAFERVFGARSLGAALVLSALTFGAMHAYQGPIGVAVTAILGALLAWRWIQLRDTKELILIHFVYNAIVATWLYVAHVQGIPLT